MLMHAIDFEIGVKGKDARRIGMVLDIIAIGMLYLVQIRLTRDRMMTVDGHDARRVAFCTTAPTRAARGRRCRCRCARGVRSRSRSRRRIVRLGTAAPQKLCSYGAHEEEEKRQRQDGRLPHGYSRRCRPRCRRRSTQRG